MAASSNRDHFFQTSTSIADHDRKQRKAANTQGDPLKFRSKLLALEVNLGFDPAGDAVFVAEAGGVLSGVRLSTNETSSTGKASTAPLTCLAYHCPSGNDTSPVKQLDIYAGGWDKTISRFHFEQRPGAQPTLVDQTSFKAHNDFVKCLLVAQSADGQSILLSGGADGELNVWSLAATVGENLAATGTRLATVQPQARGIESIAIDPYSPAHAPTIFFSTSQREIFSLTLPHLADFASGKLQSALSPPIIAHDTSVYRLRFDSDGDLWTASADKTAKHLVRDSGWTADTVLQHPDFVRDVISHPRLPYVFTACRDEEIRVWHVGSGELYHVFAGHYEEVTGLAIARNETVLLSVSIDATLRRWSLVPEELRAAVEKAKQPNLADDVPEPDAGVSDLGLTAEEEAELRAIMESEEEQTLQQMAMDEQ